MSTSFFSQPHDPTADLPSDKVERALALQNGLIALCEQKANMKEAVYKALRREFIDDPEISDLIPAFVRTNYDTSAMWAFLKGVSPHWEPRRQFVRDQFKPLIDRLERRPAASDALITEALQRFDAEGVNQAWSKALARREVDPAGAITAARTLLESVCKHLLEGEDGKHEYGPNDDLPKLYRQVSELLKIAPSQHSEDAFKRILGSAASVVEGLSTLRNRMGDAHASGGRNPIRPSSRHAALAVNLAGSMALFLIETAAARPVR